MTRLNKFYVVLLLAVAVTTMSNAQIDKSNSGGILIKAEETKESSSSGLELKRNASLSKTNNGFTIPNSASKLPNESNKPMVDMSPKKSKYIDQKFDWEPGYVPSKSLAGDIVLGKVRTKSNYVVIIPRDFGAVDGDNVRVFLNEEVINPNLYLTGEGTPLLVDLIDGENLIDFKALNMGESAPNTAEFKVIDDKGVVIFSNQWGLETGYKGTFTIVKEKY